jgi:hypothetical protein
MFGQGCINRGSLITVVTKFCTPAPNIFWPSVCKLLYITVCGSCNFEVAHRFLGGL